MPFRTLGLTLLILSSFAFAQGRKPAVEDFVGIEVDHPETLPQGTDSLYNLEKDISQIGTLKTEMPKKATLKVPSSTSQPWNLSTFVAIAIIMGLPLLSWLLVMNNLRRKASLENASNIAVLEKYRQERERAKKAESKKAA